MIVYQTTVHISLPYQLCQRAKNTQTGKPAFAYFINSGCVGPDISSACDKVGLYIMGYPVMSRRQNHLFSPNQPLAILFGNRSAEAPATGRSASGLVRRFLVTSRNKGKMFFRFYFDFLKCNPEGRCFPRFDSKNLSKIIA